MTKSDKSTVAENDKGTRNPEEIRKDIDSSWKDPGETAAAVAEKTDVKKQAQARAQELGNEVKEAAPESAEEGVHRTQQFAQKNSIPVVIGVTLLVCIILGRIFSRR